MWKCSKCKTLNVDIFNLCLNCSTIRRATVSQEMINQNEKAKIDIGHLHQAPLEVRYPALRIISGVYKFSAWIVGIATVISAFILASNSNGNEVITVLVVLLIGINIVISLLAIAEIIKVFIDIEENTRKTVDRNNR